MTRMKTIEMNVIALVGQVCPQCEHVQIPDRADGQHDMYLCGAADGKHCLAVVTTPLCVKQPLANQDP